MLFFGRFFFVFFSLFFGIFCFFFYLRKYFHSKLLFFLIFTMFSNNRRPPTHSCTKRCIRCWLDTSHSPARQVSYTTLTPQGTSTSAVFLISWLPCAGTRVPESYHFHRTPTPGIDRTPGFYRTPTPGQNQGGDGEKKKTKQRNLFFSSTFLYSFQFKS
jgi:hypothetical protein